VRAGKEVLSERLIAHGPECRALAVVGFGGRAMRLVYLLQGLQTPKNPTTGYGVIAMGFEERASDRLTFQALSPRN
jgi:hypothetical protein